MGFLVSSAPSLPLEAVLLEEPPQRLAILRADPPLAIQVIARLLHGRDVAGSHRLHQACSCLWSHPRGLPYWFVLLEHPCQPLCPIAFPPAGQLDHSSRPAAHNPSSSSRLRF